MELIKMKCPSCNADLELNPALKEAFCVYCGSKILLAGMESTNSLGQPVADEHLVGELDVLKQRELAVGRVDHVALEAVFKDHLHVVLVGDLQTAAFHVRDNPPSLVLHLC